MAECSYSRCVQERRNIRRELQKWTKNMVYIVGLERVAEELMGRRKWKLYQESLTKSSSSAPLANNFSNNNQQLEQTITNNNIISPPSFATTTTKTFTAAVATLNNNHTIKVEESDDIENEERQQRVTPANDEEENTNINNTSSKLEERLRHPPSDTHNAKVVTTCTSSGEIIQVRDWSPSEKCLFCADGKLDSRDSETPSLLPGSALSPQESDSETSDNSHSDTETPPHPNLPTLAQTLSPHLLHNNNNPNMATIESVHSMAVSLAAVAALTNNNTLGTNPPLSFYPPGFLPPWYFNNLRNFNQEQPQQSSHTRRLDIDVASQEKLPSASQTPTPSSEQPLDLSSKSSSTTSTTSACSTTSNNSTHSTTPISGIVQSQIDPSKIPRIPPTTMDTKHIFNIDYRAKPRMSTVTGRRTYTEDELQAALRDIQSGKLGTRRAAVIYGIPRSTLRNKVYKLAMERERENHLVLPTVPTVKLEDEEAADEEKELSGAEEEKEVEKVLQKPLLSMDDILRFSNLESHTSDSLRHLLQRTNKESQDILGGLDHSSLGPVIQSLLLRASSSVISGQKTDESAMKLPEMVQKMLAEDQSLTSEQLLLHSDAINNGTHERSLSRQSSTNSVIIRNDKIPPRKSGTPEVVDNETNDSSTHPQTTSDSPSNVILKIPSFKPTTSKNGSDLFRQSPNVIDPTQNSLNITPPIGGGNESSSSPTLISKGIMSLKDVIAKSISQKFQQSSPNEQIGLKMATSPVIDVDFNSLKRGRFTPPMSNISVIKNHQDIQPNRPYPQPPKPQNNTTSSSTTGGKGTRPKRGKYRNYDRDSLVEAVRAVQRGEMSVHRAGSYYGVPHSTLEYKVKERHLMRPRKRDPKPQPPDDKTTPPKSQEQIRNLNDKTKAPCVKPPTQKFSPTSPNGLKMPLFDPSIPPIGYNHPPFPFWAHPTFHPMSIPSTSGFPPHPDLFATQMMQRLQDNVQNVGTSPQSTTVTNPAIGNSSAREIAESLYDGSGANGNFLDGIIRSSLEMGIPGSSSKGQAEDKNITPENMSNKALLDQLCRNSRLTPLPKPNLLDPHSSGDESSSYHSKRTQSPINFSKDFPDTKLNDNVPINFSGSKSPKLDDRFSNKRNSSDIVELSNDSNESTHISERKRKLSMDNQSEGDRSTTTSPSPTSRIYVKPQFQEITKPENLKPEILVRTYARLHENLSECAGTEHIVTDHNGIKETAENIESASAKPEAGQD